MIKFKGDHKGRDFVGLCLEKGNVKRLQRGVPIHIFGAEMGLSHDIMIFYGETQQEIIKQLEKQGFELPPQAQWHRSDNPRN